MGGGCEWPEPVALEFPAAGGRAPPRRLRRRLLEARRGGSAPASVEEIEAKLREAGLRRQQFYELLSCKAKKQRSRSPCSSSQEEDLGQRLEARLFAAEQKRLSLLEKAQKRLSRLDKLRQAAKNGVEIRIEKEREELGSRVESRVQQAEKKRLLLLEAEKRKAQARVQQVRRVAKAVCRQREIARRRMEEQLESRLQRAKRQRAEYLRQRGSPRSTARPNMNKQAEYLSSKLAKCWRRFVSSRKTTLSLAKAYQALGVNKNTIDVMPFEQVAVCIEQPAALQTTKELLDRLENRFLLSQAVKKSSTPENIDHLLKRIATPRKKVSPMKSAKARGSTKKGPHKLPRYSVRVVFCAYMVLGHPNAVFNEQGEREKILVDSAKQFVDEFELLIKIILDGPDSVRTSRPSSPESESNDCHDNQECSRSSLPQKTFRSQLENFDKAWCSYLYHFMVWKVKDARSLEDDLVKAACHLELSMMQTCKLSFEGQKCNLSHDMRAIQKQVNDDQKLLREKVQHLSGDAGLERMKTALSETRSKFFAAKENGSPMVTSVAQIVSPLSYSLGLSAAAARITGPLEAEREPSKPVARSLFGASSSQSESYAGNELRNGAVRERPVIENELLANEIIHEADDPFTGYLARNESDSLKEQVKHLMEKAFWDGVIDSMKGDNPDYSRLTDLVKEVRDELVEIAPHSWRGDIGRSFDLEFLSQILESGNPDGKFLGEVLEFSLSLIEKLCAPVNDKKIKEEHHKLLQELGEISFSDSNCSSFIVAVVKGLRFVLEEIQVLKKEISKARIELLQPIIKGQAGSEYLKKAFADRYGPPTEAFVSLPLTLSWVSSVTNIMDAEWNAFLDSLSASSSQIVVTIRSGIKNPAAQPSDKYPSDKIEGPMCSGEILDKLTRVGLLHLISSVQGLTAETLPETFKLNLLRLRSIQGQYQQVVVMASSMLILRQVIATENPPLPPKELEAAHAEFVKILTKLIDGVPDVGLEEIVETMLSSCRPSDPDPVSVNARKEFLARMLIKSLQSGDPVFVKVSKAVHVAFRAVVLGGSGARGRRLAEAALQRLGAGCLVDRVAKASEALIRAAMVSARVHGPWYDALLRR